MSGVDLDPASDVVGAPLIPEAEPPARRRRSVLERVRAAGSLREVFAVVTLLALRWSGVVLQFGLSVVLGRTLGAEGTGVYLLFTSWGRLISRVATLGLPKHVLRSCAVLMAEGKADRAIAFVRKAVLLSTALGLGLAAVAALGDRWLAPLLLPGANYPFLLAMALLSGTLLGVTIILSSALMGQSRPNWGLAIEFNLLPAVILCAIAVSWLGWRTLETGTLLWSHIGATAAMCAAAWLVVRSTRRVQEPARAGKRKAALDGVEPGSFPPRALSVLWVNGMLASGLITLPMILLPQFASGEEIGQYGVSMRVVAVAGTVLNALASYFAPRFAQAYAHGNARALARNLRLSQVYALTFYAPVFIISVLMPETILGIFGSEFRGGVPLFLILTIGQFFNALTGIVGMFLSMVHLEETVVRINLAAVVVLVALTIVLGNAFGAVGVATAYVLLFAAKNIALYVTAQRFLGRFEAPEPAS